MYDKDLGLRFVLGVDWDPIEAQRRKNQEEIFKAVQDLGNLKSLGPDGMIGEFFF